MFKRAGILMITLLYVITAMGFAVNLHYCNDRIADFEINAPVGQCIDESADACIQLTASAKKKMDCRDTHLTIKVKDDHQKESNSISTILYGLALPVTYVHDYLFLRYQVQSDLRADRSPPDLPLSDISVFLKNCTFRI